MPLVLEIFAVSSAVIFVLGILVSFAPSTNTPDYCDTSLGALDRMLVERRDNVAHPHDLYDHLAEYGRQTGFDTSVHKLRIIFYCQLCDYECSHGAFRFIDGRKDVIDGISQDTESFSKFANFSNKCTPCFEFHLDNPAYNGERFCPWCIHDVRRPLLVSEASNSEPP